MGSTAKSGQDPLLSTLTGYVLGAVNSTDTILIDISTLRGGSTFVLYLMNENLDQVVETEDLW